MTKPRILIYDLPSVGLTRYAGRIASSLLAREERARVTLLYDEEVGTDAADLRGFLPDGVEVVALRRCSADRIRSTGILRSADAVLTMAPRLPDYRVAAVAREAGALVGQVQHGLYVEFMQRDPSLWFRRVGKAIWYARCALDVGKWSGAGRIAVLAAALDHFAMGGRLGIARKGVPGTSPDVAYVYGSYWESFFREHYGYDSSEYVHTGYPDLEGIKGAGTMEPEAEVCYVCQSLVEDGRIQRSTLVSFLDALVEAVRLRGSRVAFKLHPRSDRSLYDRYGSAADLIESGIPSAPVYVGHYSSLLAAGFALGSRILLVDLPGHTIPQYFARPANAVVRADPESIAQGLSECLAKPAPGELTDVFPIPSGSVADCIAQDVLDRIEARK